MLSHEFPDSTNLQGADWEDNTLTLRFIKGSTYVYEGVPLETYNALLAAPSAGKFFHAEIKPKFAATRLTAPAA